MDLTALIRMIQQMGLGGLAARRGGGQPDGFGWDGRAYNQTGPGPQQYGGGQPDGFGWDGKAYNQTGPVGIDPRARRYRTGDGPPGDEPRPRRGGIPEGPPGPNRRGPRPDGFDDPPMPAPSRPSNKPVSSNPKLVGQSWNDLNKHHFNPKPRLDKPF